MFILFTCSGWCHSIHCAKKNASQTYETKTAFSLYPYCCAIWIYAVYTKLVDTMSHSLTNLLILFPFTPTKYKICLFALSLFIVVSPALSVILDLVSSLTLPLAFSHSSSPSVRYNTANKSNIYHGNSFSMIKRSQRIDMTYNNKQKNLNLVASC